MFVLKLQDRKGNELNIGDIVKVSDGHRISFYAEVKYLKEEKVVTPFHTFSFNSFEKVDSVPSHAIESSEKRYKIWYLPDEYKEDDEIFEDYLSSWRECERLLESRCWAIEINENQLSLF